MLQELQSKLKDLFGPAIENAVARLAWAPPSS